MPLLLIENVVGSRAPLDTCLLHNPKHSSLCHVRPFLRTTVQLFPMTVAPVSHKASTLIFSGYDPRMLFAMQHSRGTLRSSSCYFLPNNADVKTQGFAQPTTPVC